MSLLPRQEGGQVLAFAAIAMTSIIGFCAFVIDVGSWYQVSRQAQAAADAGATAAANDLPGNASQARTDATTYVNKNIAGATTTTATPYNSDSSQVMVTVTKSAPTYFAKIFGLSSVTVTKSAVAKHVSGGSKYAIFTKNTSCSSGITWTASGVTIAGGVRSNSILSISGGSNTFGPTTYKGPNGCNWSDTAGSNTYGGSSSPTADTSNTAWPEPWPTSASEISSYGITCTDSAASFTWMSSPGPQSGHTYCATSSISIKGSNYNCSCTFIAPTVSITGAGETLRPNYSDLLIDAYGTTTWKLSGSGDNITGTVFVPNATFNVSGSADSLYNVFLEGNNATMTGSGWTLTGTGPVTGPNGGTQLTQ
jgi:Flp pilus assembly protein TadG